jgi:D-alanine--poly(phosphoribitol) ligase subunit 1
MLLHSLFTFLAEILYSMRFDFESREFLEAELDSAKLAVIGENRELTWGDFRSEVERLCEYLNSEIGLGENAMPVMIYGHKNAEMIVAVYACLRLRIPYIPIDELYPLDRIARVSQIAESRLILNCSGSFIKLDGPSQLLVGKSEFILKNGSFDLRSYSEPRLQIDLLVYIIFTSGSTGEPKGVQISNSAVITFIDWMTHDFGFTKDDVFLNIAVFSFDLSVFELMTFGALGATLLLNGRQTLESADKLLNRIDTYRATIWVSTPSFSMLYARDSHVQIRQNIGHFLFCGEVLPYSLAKELKKHYPSSRVLNTYGPTEATVATTLIEIDETILTKYEVLPVGYSKRDSEVVIEDSEIVIYGDNVSVGYLNRDDLNRVKFGMRDGKRFFRTGDLGYIEDGLLFCRGRNDDQIKLRGYRIELNEITSKLESLDFVHMAATIALKRNEEVKKIVSLVVLKFERQGDVRSEIQELLKHHLPEYMIPSDVKMVESLPLNQNGKIDKSLLPELYMRS